MDLLFSKIYKTFVFQDRYLLFLEGFRNTIILTILSFICGILFGILISFAVSSKNETLRKSVTFIRSLLIEIPTMVLLMIFVYLIFGESAVPVFWIVAAALTLKSAAFLSEIFMTCLSVVNKGEIEASRTLGMTSLQAFKFVVLPQVVQAALPLCKNQFITTMQETSVVGYLAVMDLTRASSVVSSRTLDAFFGLILITVIYFLVGATGKGLLNSISKFCRIRM